MKLITKSLREVRKDADLTLQELADKSGVPYSTLQAVEAGHYRPSVLIAHKIAATLRVPALVMFPRIYAEVQELMDVLRKGGSISK